MRLAAPGETERSNSLNYRHYAGQKKEVAMVTARVLHLNPVPESRERVGRVLSGKSACGWSFELVYVEDHKGLGRALEGCGFDCVVLGHGAAGSPAVDALDAVRAKCPGACIVLLVRPGEEHSGLAAVRRGAEDFVLDHSDYIGRLPGAISAAITRARARGGRGEDGDHGAAARMRRDIDGLGRARVDLERAKADFAALTERLLYVQEEERAQISRELHDEIGQSLGAVEILLASARSQLAEARIQPADRRIEEARGINARLLAQVRDIAQGLRPAQLDALGLVPAVREHAATHLGRAGIALSLTGNVEGRRLPAPVELAAFRIVQEAVANVMRHAGASRVEIGLEIGADALAVTVRDDGCGFDPGVPAGEQARRGLGLIGMRERAAALGGSLTVLGEPGGGTTVRARIPVKEGGA